MIQPQIQHNGMDRTQNEDTIDLKKLVFKLLSNWYWFLLSIVITVGAGFLYNRYATPMYELSTTLLVEEDKVTSPLNENGATANVFQGFGVMNSMRNIYNQMVIMNSTPIISRTLDELDFEVSYFAVGRVKTSERYKEVPFQVIWDEDHPQLVNAEFFLTIDPNGKLHLKVKGENAEVYSYKDDEVVKKIAELSFEKEFDPGTRLAADEFSFTILLNERFDQKALNDYKFSFNTKNSLLKRYSAALSVSLADKETSIVNLTLRDFNKQKGIDFLNKLTEIYQLDNLGKKNDNANRTIQFINTQLQNISDSLIVSENQMASFQSENQMIDISLQSQQLLEQMRELDNERVALETQNKYYHYLKDYVQNNQELETLIAPSAMGIDDPLLNSLILQLNDLITEKSSLTSIRANSNHPAIVRLNAQIESVKNSLLENTTNIISQSDIALEDRYAGFRLPKGIM